MKRTSAYLTDGQAEALESIASETDMSKSEALRRLVAEGLDGMDDAEELIPEHVRVKTQREEVKAENRVNDWRGGFEGRVKDQLLARWKNGYRGDELADVAQGYVSEARVLWPDDQQRASEAISYVRATVEELQDAREGEDMDPLDVESAVAAHSGMAERERERAVEALDDEELEAMTRAAYQQLTETPATPAMVVDGIAGRFDVSEQAAEEAVERAEDSRK